MKFFDSLLLANFGGPRDLQEIKPFLTSLLTDQNLICTSLPPQLHQFLFSKIAYLRALSVKSRYEAIGGSSPLYRETEELAQKIEEKSQWKTFTFHRYLEKTHFPLIEKLEEARKKTLVFPLFPHTSAITMGSFRGYLSQKLSEKAFSRLAWIGSYATHPAFLSLWQEKIERFLSQKKWAEQETILLFSAHNVPKRLIASGDYYEKEIRESSLAIASFFPRALSQLGYQSRFGWSRWLTPSMKELLKSPQKWAGGRDKLLIIPISFTQDHLETLWEIDREILPLARIHGFRAERLDCFGVDLNWVKTIVSIVESNSNF